MNINYFSIICFILAAVFALITVILIYKAPHYKLWYIPLILMSIAFISGLTAAYGVLKNNQQIILISYFIFFITSIISIFIIIKKL